MIRLTINHSGPAAGVNVWHFGGELDGTNEQEAADAATAFLQAIDVGVRNSQTMEVDPEVLEINVGTGATEGAATVTTTPVPGTAVDEAVPQAASLLMRWRTGQFAGGREVRGRSFLPGFSLLQNTATGEVEPDTIAFMNGAGADLIDNSDFGIWAPARSVFATVNSASCWNEWAVMRSRRS